MIQKCAENASGILQKAQTPSYGSLRWFTTPALRRKAYVEATYLTRGPRELPVSKLHVESELPSVDTAILPLLHPLDKPDVGPLQVLLSQGAFRLLLILPGIH